MCIVTNEQIGESVAVDITGSGNHIVITINDKSAASGVDSGEINSNGIGFAKEDNSFRLRLRRKVQS